MIWRVGDRSRVVVRIWVLLGLLLTLILVPLLSPLEVVWRDYRLHQRGERAEAELVERLERQRLALRFTTGPHAGRICSANAPLSVYERAEPGASLPVVYLAERPGDCVLASTVETSAFLLWALVPGLVCVVLLFLGIGIWLQRSFTRPGLPRNPMQVAPDAVACPVCGAGMVEGYLPLLAGVHWREIGEPIGLPHALGGLPGTVGWRGRPLLHAFRCAGCEVITFRYGFAKPVRIG
jgi:hypothetical protein